MKRSYALSLPALVLITSMAWSDEHDHSARGHDHHDHATTSTSDSPSTKAFEEINARMHESMTVEMTGDADVDFMRGMIPHHQGAVDMAEVVMKYGKDPEVRKLAEEVIKAQKGEIAFMKDWLAKRGR